MGNDPLEFIFGDLVDDFREEETRVLCALTYFTLPAKVEHIAELAQCSESDADPALRSLVNRSLVVPSQELKTFALVPLVADFLRKKKPEVVAETGNRLEKGVVALVLENGFKRHDRFHVLDAAWPTVAAALPRFLTGPDDWLQAICSGLDDFLNFTGRWDEQLALSEDAESRAVAEGNLDRAGRRAYDAGWIHYLRNQSAEVLDCAARAEAHWLRAQAGVQERATAIQLRCLGHRLAKDYAAAISAAREVVELHSTLARESNDVASSLNSLAGTEMAIGELEAAERDCSEALRIARANDSREGISASAGNLAEIFLRKENWPGAEALAGEALLLAEKVGKKETIARNSHRLAVALVHQGKKAKALAHARRAVDLYTQLGLAGLASARETLAECES